jgi:acetylornithine deacetylase
MPASLSDAELLARLVAFDTTSRNSNLAMAEFLTDYLDRPGIRTVEDRADDGRKTNLIVVAGPAAAAGAGAGDARPGLVLSGHMDVVPADEDGWTSDPFTLTDAGDRLVGRGAADMKGFLALAANLTRETDLDRLAAPLVLVLTYDEEVGTLGAKHLVESLRGEGGRRAAATALGGPLPRAAIIGEPTSLAVVGLHKGHLKVRAILHGRSAHSGYPHLGANAVEAGARVIAALGDLRRRLEEERPPHHERFPDVPFVALNVGTVRGGTAINVVPDRCTVETGVRLLPGMDSAAMIARLREAAAAAAGEVPLDFEVLSDSPPMRLADDAPIAAALCALTGRERLASANYATDAGWLQRLGLDCAVFGPGSIEVAHRPDEHVPKAELAAARAVLARAVERFCGAGAAG